MSQSQDRITRKEFIEHVASIALPVILVIAALVLAFSVYNIADSPGGGYKLLLLVLLLIILAYPALKRRYRRRLWDSLPPFIQRSGLALKIVVLLLEACLWLLLGLYMPLLLVLACIALMIENYRLRRDLEALEES
jgi:multisubunit Na+/H+ antiporter MnhB subunit